MVRVKSREEGLLGGPLGIVVGVCVSEEEADSAPALYLCRGLDDEGEGEGVLEREGGFVEAGRDIACCCCSALEDAGRDRLEDAEPDGCSGCFCRRCCCCCWWLKGSVVAKVTALDVGLLLLVGVRRLLMDAGDVDLLGPALGLAAASWCCSPDRGNLTGAGPME